MKRLYFLLFYLFFFSAAWSQIAPGKWNYHLSMLNASEVVEAGQKIYFLSEGGLFYFNKKDNSIETITKNESISGADFSGLSYNETTKCIIVTYKNSCVDIIREDGSIFPILDIKRKTISGDKSINGIANYGKYAYLACSFGIVVVDIEKLQIKDSYIIGNYGSSMAINDVAFIDGYIFASTAEGIKYAPLEGKNLLDFSNWDNVENVFLKDFSYNILETGWGRLWAIHNTTEWNGDHTVSRHAADIWYPEFEADKGVIRNFKITNGYLIYCEAKPEVVNVDGKETVVDHASVVVYNEQREKVLTISTYPFAKEGVEIRPLSAIIDNQGILWIADQNYGSIRYENGNFTRLTPEGPFNNYVYSLTYADGVLWSASGGKNQYGENNYFDFNVNKLINGKWESFNWNSGVIDRKYKDAIQVMPQPGNPDRFFVASWGFGLFEFENGTLKKVYNEKNSPLQTRVEGDNYTRIGGLGYDSGGNLWMTNSLVNNNLHKLKPDGTWESLYLPEVANIDEINVGQILITKNDDIWIIVPHDKTKGIYVVNKDGSIKKQLDVIVQFSNGTQTVNTPMNDVYSFAEDLDGAIWVGTSNGIAVYSDPTGVFTSGNIYANQPGLDLKDGYYHALLQNVTVTSIVVDGGNRKWCGSKSDGLFLISDDGEHELEHFTTENSPLISDNITSLAYDGESGILYIGTQLGLVSYRTDSKDANEGFGKVYAYPNPVRENYKGNIYITGLVFDTNVKITTASGRLVYETKSNGGQAVWDGNDLAGNRVHTGVYLAFCASADGSQSTVTKILFIR